MESPYFKSGSPVLKKAGASMVVIMLLLTILPVFGKVYAAINIQPALLDLANWQPQEPVSVIVQKAIPGNSLEQAVPGLGGTVTHDLEFINSFAAQIPAGQVPLLAAKPGIRWVSLDAPVVKSICDKCMADDDDSNYTSAVNADKVWNTKNGKKPWLQGNDVGVAILDSGVNGNLLDFTKDGGDDTRVISSVKIEAKTPTLNDTYGHGTLVAGVIGSNGLGSDGAYPGIAPKANLVNVKVSDGQGAASTSDILAGLQWVAKNAKKFKIRVVNLSINSTVAQSYNVDPLDAGVEALWFSGITVVVSAGNNGTANLFAPANDPFVITVGAVTNNDRANPKNPKWKTAPFSAYGKDESGGTKPDLVAPGTGIVSDVASPNESLASKHKTKLIGNDYLKVAGTSFAAPQVAGAVALLLQSEPDLTPDQIKYRLKATALSDQPKGNWDNRTSWKKYDAATNGAGLLDIYAAISQKDIDGKANQGAVPSALLMSVLVELKLSPVPGTAVNYDSVNWSSVNWSSVNWSSVNWSSVNWSSVNWSSVNWSSVNWSSVNWSSVNWSNTVWTDD